MEAPIYHLEGVVKAKEEHFQLIQLVGNHDQGAAGVLKPLEHGAVVIGGPVPDIYNHHTQGKQVGPAASKQ